MDSIHSLFDTATSSRNFENLFDTKTALSALFLWLLFGFLSTMVGCDIQKMMRDSLLLRHAVGLFSFFLLFTLSDTKNASHITLLWIKTIAVYGVFLMMVKSKWYFTFPVLILLIVDQTIKAHRNYLAKLHNQNADVKKWDSARSAINIALTGTIAVGFGHYAFRQYKEFGRKFSINTLLFSYKCA
jgi:hypothetical protein